MALSALPVANSLFAEDFSGLNLLLQAIDATQNETKPKNYPTSYTVIENGTKKRSLETGSSKEPWEIKKRRQYRWSKSRFPSKENMQKITNMFKEERVKKSICYDYCKVFQKPTNADAIKHVIIALGHYELKPDLTEENKSTKEFFLSPVKPTTNSTTDNKYKTLQPALFQHIEFEMMTKTIVEWFPAMDTLLICNLNTNHIRNAIPVIQTSKIRTLIILKSICDLSAFSGLQCNLLFRSCIVQVNNSSLLDLKIQSKYIAFYNSRIQEVSQYMPRVCTEEDVINLDEPRVTLSKKNFPNLEYIHFEHSSFSNGPMGLFSVCNKLTIFSVKIDLDQVYFPEEKYLFFATDMVFKHPVKARVLRFFFQASKTPSPTVIFNCETILDNMPIEADLKQVYLMTENITHIVIRGPRNPNSPVAIQFLQSTTTTFTGLHFMDPNALYNYDVLKLVDPATSYEIGFPVNNRFQVPYDKYKQYRLRMNHTKNTLTLSNFNEQNNLPDRLNVINFHIIVRSIEQIMEKNPELFTDCIA